MKTEIPNNSLENWFTAEKKPTYECNIRLLKHWQSKLVAEKKIDRLGKNIDVYERKDIDQWSKCSKVNYGIKFGSITVGYCCANKSHKNQLPLLIVPSRFVL